MHARGSAGVWGGDWPLLRAGMLRVHCVYVLACMRQHRLKERLSRRCDVLTC